MPRAHEEAIAAHVNLERDLPKPNLDRAEEGFVLVARGPLMTTKAASMMRGGEAA